jgi:hypothetical protein
MSQVSAIERLQTLPDIFRGADLTVRFGWTSKTASHYLYLWRKRALVQPLGGHSDVFANLLVNRQPNWEAALLLAMPSALVIGIEALRRAGWTTQIPVRPEVAVSAAEPVFSVERFEIQKRPALWFEQTQKGVRRSKDARTLPVLAPAWALADLLSRAPWGACGLDPDDIEWDEITVRDEREWKSASVALGMEPMPLREVVDR